jgi:hypothetical protein
LRGLRKVRKTIASSPNESNANVPGSGTLTEVGGTPPPLTTTVPPPPDVTVRPPLKPLVLAEQVLEMVLLPAKVTSPVDAKSLPQVSVTPVVVMLVLARTFPNITPERVAELPISQYTPALAASKRPGAIATTPEDVSELPMKTQFGWVTLRVFVRVRVPVKLAAPIL